MVIGRDELERIEEELAPDRLIHKSVYCGKCGYNLRTLPHVYTCPECGHAYNARPRKMKGIYAPGDTYLPVSDVFWVLLCLAIAWILAPPGFMNAQYGRAWFGVAFAAVGVGFAIRGCVRLMRHLDNRAVQKRITEAQEDEED